MIAGSIDLLRGTRGRPSAPWHSNNDVVSLNYLIRISKKYELETSKLLECIHGAWVRGGSSFNGVSVQRRQMIGGDGVFLITHDKRIMAQLKLTSKLLEYLGKPDAHNLRFVDHSVTREARVQPENLMIKDLTPMTKRFNLDAKVVEKSTPRIVVSRWGKEFLVSTATIKDRSGMIKLPLWNDQVSMVSIGDRLNIENARLKRFRGELQVRMGKFSRLKIVHREGKSNHLRPSRETGLKAYDLSTTEDRDRML